LLPDVVGFGLDGDTTGCVLVFVLVRFGGNGGSSPTPHGGAFTTDPGVVALVLPVGLPVLVEVDRDVSDVTESIDAADALRGGSDGASWLELLRAGRGGGFFCCCLEAGGVVAMPSGVETRCGTLGAGDCSPIDGGGRIL
jgi:hypothetical protein